MTHTEFLEQQGLLFPRFRFRQIFSLYAYLFSEFLPVIYIIGHYNPSVRIIDLAFHTTLTTSQRQLTP